MDERPETADVAKLADMLAAMGTEPRLRIMRLLLSALPEGLVVSEIQENLGSTARRCLTTSNGSGTRI